ncbi:MbnP family copper-binding protein [Brumicola nitratireducens]|nr:MbnP family copper-binding protein [Glaciecola nitratireducens]
MTYLFDQLLTSKVFSELSATFKQDLNVKHLVLICALILSACSPAPESATASNGAINATENGINSHDAENQNEVQIIFTPYFQEQEIQCGQALNIQNEQWRIIELSMFFSQFSLNFSERFILDDNDWQSQQVALIRPAIDCEESTANTAITAKINGGRVNYDAKAKTPITLSFNVGVPFAVNHQNPLIQGSPLNDSSMFWVWRNGYKFIRWDMQSESGDPWSFHLGSVGCESAAMVRAPQKPCAQPNLIPVAITLPFDSIQLVEADDKNSKAQRLQIKVSIHLDAILGNIEATRKNSCMFSGIDSTTCTQLLENLKLNAIFK